MGKAFEKHRKIIKDERQKQVDALKCLGSSANQLPSIKDFISKDRLNPEIIDEIERIEEEETKMIEVKWFTKYILKPMILENLALSDMGVRGIFLAPLSVIL